MMMNSPMPPAINTAYPPLQQPSIPSVNRSFNQPGVPPTIFQSGQGFPQVYS